MRLPLLKDRPFFHRLELTGAARYSDYSTSGSTTTFSAGLNWEPIEELLFRGSWAEGFRAPSIGELFGTPSRFDQEVVDPCSGFDRRLAGHRPRQLHRPGRAGQRLLRAAQRAAAGDHRRQPEFAARDQPQSWGGGMVWRPQFARRLLGRGQLLQHPGRRRDPGDRRRRPARPLRQHRRCLQLRCDHPLGLGPGHPDPRLPAEHRRHRHRRHRRHLQLPHGPKAASARSASTGPAPSCSIITVTVPATNGTTTIDREGTEQGSPDQAFPQASNRPGSSTGTCTARRFAHRPLHQPRRPRGTATGSARASTPTCSCASRRAFGDSRIGFAFGVNNLFNVDPPACFSCGLNNMDPTTYDVPGRFFYGRVTFRM